MAGGSSAALSRDIQTLFDAGTAVGLTDRQLLDRFAGRRDPAAEAAFEVLVLRHGPMVLRVCRNALHDPNDAQDAFQATFLVLVRRCGSSAGSIRSGAGSTASPAGWRRGRGSRRRGGGPSRTRGRCGSSRPSSRPMPTTSTATEFGPIVQEEVRRLPEKYRAVVVLCYWEGLTQEQAAAQLGCPIGTVRSRLARARDLLRRRLTRRGLEPLAVGIGIHRRLPPLAPDWCSRRSRRRCGRGRSGEESGGLGVRWLPWSRGCSGG